MENAIVYSKWGGPEELSWSVLPDKLICRPDTIKLATGEILVEVKAISINPIDWKILSGAQKAVASRRFPRIFGTDFSGIVYRSGQSAENKGFAKGTRVIGMVSPLSKGSGRRWIKIKASHCIILEDSMSLEEGAGLPAAGISAILSTAFSTRKRRGKVLVFGASGGVGSLAVQILASRKWEVAVVCRPGQREKLKELGCSEFIDRDNWERELAEQSRWDAVVDCPGVIIRHNPSKYLKRRGVYSPVYIPDSLIPWQILRTVLWFFSPWSTGLFLGYASKGRIKQLQNNINKGIVKPLMDSSFPAENVIDAVDMSRKGGFLGKIIIKL